ncbi:hypothetical protein Droror1_Dr00021244 [Drosera rotundifolia]
MAQLKNPITHFSSHPLVTVKAEEEFQGDSRMFLSIFFATRFLTINITSHCDFALRFGGSIDFTCKRVLSFPVIKDLVLLRRLSHVVHRVNRVRKKEWVAAVWVVVADGFEKSTRR